jgi:glycosyltransferase involved in cell wall biosynthesis
MRITLLTSSYPRFTSDGTAPFIQSIAETLVSLGNDVSVVAPYDSLVKPMDTHGVHLYRFKYAPFSSWHIMGHARALEADVRLHPLSFLLAPSFLASAALSLLDVAKKQKSEIIYAHWVIPNGPSAAWVAKQLRLPLMISLHGSDIFVAKKNFLFRAAARWAFRQAKAVSACSPELRDGALALNAPKNTRLVPYGVDPIKFHPDKRSDEFRDKLGLKPNELAIGTIGRMVYKKGFDGLIRAFATVLSKLPHIKLIIGGSGPLLEPLKELARSLKIETSVIFAGNIDWDFVPVFLASMDLFVLPSKKDRAGNLDGLPNVLLEAMASGVPVIASDIGGVRLAVDDNLSGRIFPSGDEHSLADQIIELLQQPGLRKTLADQARIKIEKQLNWRYIAGELLEMLQE